MLAHAHGVGGGPSLKGVVGVRRQGPRSRELWWLSAGSAEGDRWVSRTCIYKAASQEGPVLRAMWEVGPKKSNTLKLLKL